LPTLFIAECVLVYLPPEASQRLVQWCADTCRDAVGFVLYEQIKPDDAFGKQMLINLEVGGSLLNTYSTRTCSFFLNAQV
jgi:tRNA wybutosine-synthesizing protein 4